MLSSGSTPPTLRYITVKWKPRHGHTLQVALWVSGESDTRGMVAEFSELKPAMRDAVAPLRRRTLVPGRGPELRITPNNESLSIICGRKRYLLPAEDVTMLHSPTPRSKRWPATCSVKCCRSCRAPDWCLRNLNFPSFRAPRPLPAPTLADLTITQYTPLLDRADLVH